MKFALFLVLMSISVSALADAPVEKKLDKRLDVKVSLEADNLKLIDIAKILTEKTGVAIEVGNDKRDWRVQERRVTICAKDVPFGTLMEQIAKTLGYCLTRYGKQDEWTYLYWQDLKGRQLEAEMLDADKEAVSQRLREYREKAVNSAKRALELSPEDALKKRDEDPWTAFLGGTTKGRGLAKILAELGPKIPTVEDVRRYGGFLADIPISSLSPELQQAALDASGALGYPHRPKETPYKIELLPIKPGSLSGDIDWLGVGGMMFLMHSPDGKTVGSGDMFPIAAPGSPMGSRLSRRGLAVNEGVDPEKAEADANSADGNSANLANALGRKSPTEENPPTDPDLTHTVELGEIPKVTFRISGFESDPDAVYMTIQAISKALGRAVLLESFEEMTPPCIFMKPGKQPAYNILIALEKAGYVWTKQDSMFRIRPDDWATRRTYLISEDLINHYKQILDQQGEFTLDDLTDIVSSLDDKQIENTFLKDPDFKIAISSLDGYRGLLLFYRSLSAQQKAAIESESGLSFGQIRGEVWDRFSEAFINGSDGIRVLDGNIRRMPDSFKKPWEDIDKNRITFQVTMIVAGQDQPKVITFTIHLVSKDDVARRREELKNQSAANKTKQEPAQAK